MKRSTALVCLLAISTLNAGGCPEAPSGLPVGTELTVEQRMAVLDGATEKMDTLVGKSPDEIGQAMLDWINGRPEFTESGLTDEGDVWALYSDGQLFLVPTKIDLTTADPDGPPKLKPDHRTEKTLDLPSTLNARLATVRSQGLMTFVNGYGGWLTDAGYNVAVAHELGVEGFRSINGSHSIVYLDAHGMRLSPNSKYNPSAHHRFLLSTNTYLTGSLMKTYENEIKSGALVPIVAYFGFQSATGNITVTPKPTLFITAKFVRENMKFATDSFVFINACDSYSTDFRDACFEVGASVYAGWSKPVYDGGALNMASLVFDRMLGGNRFLPPTPRRSAQTWAALYDEMKSQGTDYKMGPDGPAQIIFAGNPNDDGGDFAQFSPSISDRMRVDEEKGYLIISGFFGYRPGKVTINGTELELVGAWGPTRLGCHIPNSGANAAGTVQVWVDGRPSNSANLTMWEGTINLMIDGQGSLTTTAEINVRLRGDVRYDLTPDAQSPSSSIAQWTANSDSTCKVNAFGESTDGGTTTTWTLSGPSEFPLNRGMHNPANSDYIYFANLVPAQRTLYLHFEVRGVANYTYTTIGRGTPDTGLGHIAFWSSQFFDGVSPYNYRIPLLIGGDYTIVGGSKNDLNPGAYPMTLTWTSMTVHHPPDITQGR